MSKLLHALTLLAALMLYRMMVPTTIPGNYAGSFSTNSQLYLTVAETGLD
ncbi:MAG: hypothetical protein AAF243_09195 [Cyanobacteria bacterium P01_A01_bin.137]